MLEELGDRRIGQPFRSTLPYLASYQRPNSHRGVSTTNRLAYYWEPAACNDTDKT